MLLEKGHGAAPGSGHMIAKLKGEPTRYGQVPFVDATFMDRLVETITTTNGMLHCNLNRCFINEVNKRTNPKWIRDEEILLVISISLLVIKSQGRHPEVMELSNCWRNAMAFFVITSIHFSKSSRNSTQASKPQEHRHWHGMPNASAIDRQILNEFVDHTEQLSGIAASVRKGIGFAQRSL